MLIGERFEVLRLIGHGGMGSVYEARERETGERVAIKLMQRADAEERERFFREIEVLRTLSHPAIVKYIDHGELPYSGPYLVMEWLSGVGLEERLSRERLSVEEALALGERIASALACAHTHGVVHRDIKPSNIFLPDSDVRRAVLLDFGIARRMAESKPVTRTGIFMGTAGYVPPEQARGEREISARADVFALGCVLFECLVGKPAFTGQHVVAVLAKVLFEDVPRISSLRAGVPLALDTVVARMLAKQPSERYADGGAVVAALSHVASGDRASEPPPSLRMRHALGSDERRLVCVLLLSAAGPSSQPVDPFGGTMRSQGVLPMSILQSIARAFGARVEPLADGSLALVLAGGGMPMDLAMQAARCALALRAKAPNAPMVLVTGRGVLSGSLPVGEAIDRAAVLLRQAEEAAIVPIDSQEAARLSTHIVVDELTAELLSGRFEIQTDGSSRTLVGEAQAGEGVRPLLGRMTPCVGREREIATLYALYEECASEQVARAVIVTGAAGLGKSRIRQELLQKIEASEPAPEIWIAHGDPTRTGASFGIAGQLLRRAVKMREDDPLDVRHEKIRSTIERHLDTPSPRMAEFIGELVGAPFSDEGSAVLRLARRDPVVMGGELRRAFEDFASGVSSKRPLVIVLEDMHWVDPTSTELLDATLRIARERPLFVLAVARPDVFDRFPTLWADRGAQEIRLGELPRRAGEKLARYVLGDDAPPSLLTRVVLQAAGNPFFLEELLRAVSEGRETSLPQTVMAMLQARLESLSPESRWVLRAGSIFGEAFWRGGVRVLLGGDTSVVDVDRWIQTLVQRELLVPRRDSRFVGEEELVFRHDLVREAAYDALMEEDRVLGHRLAAEWLEKAGERDAMVLAEHNERGGDAERAAFFFARAATQALAADDFQAVLDRSERAIACGAKGSLLGEVHQALAEAHFYRGELAEAARHAREAMRHLSPESPLWFGAASAAAWAESSRGERRQLLGIAEAKLERVVHEGSAHSRRLQSMGWITRMLLRSGQTSAAATLIERFESAPAEAKLEPLVQAEWAGVWATRSLMEGDLEGAYGFFLESAARFEAARVARFGLSMRVYAAMVRCDLGEHEAAAAELEALALRADASCLPMLAASARHGLAEALLGQGKLSLARQTLEDILETLTDAGLVASAHDVRQLLALVLVEMGASDAAEIAAIEAVALVDAPPSRRCSYLATLARVLIACARPGEALSAAEEAMELLGEVGVLLSDEPLVRLVYAEALLANGLKDRAKNAIQEAREHVERRASKIAEPTRRARFLRGVRDNARTIELATTLLGMQA